MNDRSPVLIILALGWCLFTSFWGTSQESFCIPSEEQVWGSPYPGLGNVRPSPTDPFLSPPSARMLYADEESYSELSPTMRSGDLYLSRHPNNKRTGIFQKFNSHTLWVPVNSSKGLGMTEIDLSAMLALPMPTPDSPLLLTPKFSATFLDTKNDGSETFYTTGLSMRWIRPIAKDKFTMDFGMSVLYSGDFHVRAGDALRLPSHAAGIWNLNPRTKLVVGVVYADRKDNYNWFPMAGLIWTPNEDVSVELLLPRLRIAQRIRWFGSAAGDEQSDWLYTAFEFGGGSWGYEPIDGRVEYSDWRLLLGYERRTRRGSTLGIEVGYMFERKMTNFGPEYPSDSVFLRLRSSF